MAAPIKSSLSSTIDLIDRTHTEAHKKDGLIDFTQLVWGPKKDMYGKYSVKHGDLSKMFSAGLWIEHETKSGHRKLTNKLTQVVVEYSKHDDIGPGAAISILNSVQKHLNRLFDDIIVYPKLYKYEGGYLKNPDPDFEQSAKRYLEMTKGPSKA